MERRKREVIITHLSEEVVTEILARLPLRSISRFKSVCKAWKSTIGSAYFRGLFVSLHQNTTSSWSLMRVGLNGQELMGFRGCETWDLPKSPASYILGLPIDTWSFRLALSNGLVLVDVRGSYCSFVGNPILQQWVKLPPRESCATLGLVTRVDKDGVVLSFKVVKFVSKVTGKWRVVIYSSETGIWSSKGLGCPRQMPDILSPMSLDGTLYILSLIDFAFQEPGVLLAHDFYSESDHFRVIHLPDHPSPGDFRKALSTSGGNITYIKTLSQEVDLALKVWKLNNDECWQLLWDIRLPIISSNTGYYPPVAMHPFDSDIVYIWSEQDLVSINLRTSKHSDNDGQLNGSIDRSVCEICMRGLILFWASTPVCILSQFVLPRWWIESVPCPPHTEIVDTTSLLSFVTSIQKKTEDGKHN